MKLPENKFLACAVLFAPPLSLTTLLLVLRWGFFFMALGTLAFWFTTQTLWSLYCARSDREAVLEENEELFL